MKRKIFTGAAVMGLVLAASGIAYAFFSAAASGNGSATAFTLNAPTGGSIGTRTATSLVVNLGSSSGLPSGGWYIVLRGSSSGTEVAIAAGGCSGHQTGPSCTDDTGLSAGTPYYYKVQAEVGDNWVSPKSSEFSGTTLAAPTVSISAPATGTVSTEIAAGDVNIPLAAGASPTGTITVTVFGPQATAPTDCTTGGTAVGGTITVSGNATYNPTAGFTPPSAGNYWWYASYSGDVNNASATSTCGGAMSETVVSASTPSSGVIGPAATTTTASGVMTVNYPTGTASGDLLILVVAGNVEPGPNADPSGWTKEADPHTGNSTIGLHVRVYYKIAGAETSVSVTAATQTGAAGSVAWVVRYDGSSGPTTFRCTSNGDTASAATFSPGTCKTTKANETEISIAVNRTGNSLSLSAAAGFTFESTAAATPGTASDALGIADQLVATTNTTPAAPTWSNGGTSSLWAGATLGFS